LKEGPRRVFSKCSPSEWNIFIVNVNGGVGGGETYTVPRTKETKPRKKAPSFTPYLLKSVGLAGKDNNETLRS